MLNIELYFGNMQIPLNASTVIGQLPPNYYPVTRLSFPVHNQNSANGGIISSDFQVEIGTTGTIVLISGPTNMDFIHIHYTYIAA